MYKVHSYKELKKLQGHGIIFAEENRKPFVATLKKVTTGAFTVVKKKVYIHNRYGKPRTRENDVGICYPITGTYSIVPHEVG